MDDRALIDALKKEGVLDAAAAEKLMQDASRSGRPAEELLYERRLADDAKVAGVKSALLGVPLKAVSPDDYDEKLLQAIPEETVRVYKVAPLALTEDMLVAGMVDPHDSKAQEALKFVARRKRLNLGVYLISYGDWQKAIHAYSPYKKEIEAALRSLDLKGEGSGRRVVELEKGVGGAEEAPVIRIVAQTLREGVAAGASDVHIEPQEDHLRVRFRVDGSLREAATLPVELAQPVVSRVKVMSNLKIDETRVPQDGRFRTKVFDRYIDFRVSTFPTPLGEKAAVRVLDPTTGVKSIDGLGLEGRNAELIREGLARPFGTILLTGPTGSGKTTTLYALLQELNRVEVNIVSLEDPVEYFVAGVNQSQVQPEIGYDFASGLRQILRQDPDVILVGEIRDRETAGLAIHAALTGHIVLSTLHTNNAVGAIPRLIDMKVEPFLLPSTLTMVIAQRLVSRLCEACKKKSEAPPPIQNVIKKALAGLPAGVTGGYEEPYVIYRAPGCAECRDRGTKGRIGLFEVLKMSPALEEIVMREPTASRLSAQAKQEAMVSLRQDGIVKALRGLVSVEEVVRETEDA